MPQYLKTKLFRIQILQYHSYYYKIFTSIFCCLCLAGCAAISFTPIKNQHTNSPGLYHRVEKGQTLWKISKLYNVDLNELIRINSISETANIEINQMLFIPKTARQDSAENIMLPAQEFSWPLKGKIIGRFGQPVNNMINNGIDISVDGNNAVLAARSGKVIFCSEKFAGFGKTIIIDHGDGFSSVYTGNSKVIVKTGDSVDKGTPIAKIYKEQKAGKDFLHFEIRKGYTPQNPNFYLPLRANRN